MNDLFQTSIRLVALRWQRVLEDMRIIKGYLNKVSLGIFLGFTKAGCNCMAAATC